MAFSIVQSAVNNLGVSLGDVLTLTFSSPVGSGNTVVGCFARQATSNAVSVVDDKGNTYTLSDTATQAAIPAHLDTFIRGNITNAPTVITITVQTGTGFALTGLAEEVSGAFAATDPRDGHTIQGQATPGTGTDGITSGTMTTAVNGDLIWGGCTAENATPTAGTSFTNGISTANFGFHMRAENRTQATAGAGTAATFTQGSAGSSIAGVIAIKAAVAATFPAGQQILGLAGAPMRAGIPSTIALNQTLPISPPSLPLMGAICM